MKQKKSKQPFLNVTGTFWLLLFLALISGFLIAQHLLQPYLDAANEMNPVGETYPMRVGEQELMVEVRNTPEGMEKGLSYRSGLPDGQGMVFLYDTPQEPLFWMKDMEFDIDVIWIREDVVVDITENLQAPTQEEPRVMTAVPKEPVDIVLEVRAGWVEESGVAVGDQAILSGF